MSVFGEVRFAIDGDGAGDGFVASIGVGGGDAAGVEGEEIEGGGVGAGEGEDDVVLGGNAAMYGDDTVVGFGVGD